VRRLLAIALLSMLVTTSVPFRADAQPDAGSEGAKAYKQHMENGVKLYQDKNYDASIVEFRAAYKAKPKASPLVNISLAYKALFQYPKAIDALEAALAKHADTMDPGDKKAAQDAIAEMRGLLAYVTVDVSPPHVTLSIDGEDQPAGTAGRPIPLGPGTHRIGAHAEGFTTADQSITVASGEKDRKLTLRLSANKGWVIIHAGDPKMAIAVDQKPRAYGDWAGFLEPGQHVVQFYRLGGSAYSMQVVVDVGKVLEVRPGVGGVTVSAPPPAVLPPPTAPPTIPDAPAKPEKPVPPVRGPFVLATASLLGPIRHPEQFPAGQGETGAAGGIRVGYRVNAPASFDVMFEYGSVTVESELAESTSYTLSSARFGPNLRIMSPGKSARLVGNLGGGAAYDNYSVDLGEYCDPKADPKLGNNCGGKSKADLSECKDGCNGFNAYLLGELGVEIDINNVLIGLAFQNYFQSIRGIDSKPFGVSPLVILGGGLRVGYAFW
jgi:hypothetical protein